MQNGSITKKFMKTIQNKFLLVLFSIAVLGNSGLTYGSEVDRRTFLLKLNAVFVVRLEMYQDLLKGIEINEKITDRIEDLINSEIGSFEDWSKLYYNETALPDGVSKISPLAAAEHYSKIRSMLDNMRIAVMGFHGDLGENPTLIEKINVVKDLAHQLDKMLDDRASELEKLFKKINQK